MGIGRIVGVVLALDRAGRIVGTPSAAETLATTLAAGNTPGANDIAMGIRSITFGGVRIGEGAATELLVDNGAGGAARLTVAGTVGESLALDGLTDRVSLSDTATIEWSNSTDHTDPKDLRLRHTGVSALVVDDGAGGAATLSVPGAGADSESFGATATTGANVGCLAAGAGSSVTGGDGTAIGQAATAGIAGTACGRGAMAPAQNGAAYGNGSQAAAVNGSAFGTSSRALHVGAIVLGRATVSTAPNQLVAGSATSPIFTVYIGQGVTAVLPSATLTFNATSTTVGETDVAGTSLVLAAGAGTGISTVTTFSVQTPNVLGTGSVVQTLVTRLTIDESVAVFTVPVGLDTFTVATLPAVTAGRLIHVSDETGGAVAAYSDGTNWRRVSDGTIVA